jgi:hypothetical protein
MEFLSEYKFNIKHIKGKENKVVGALGRRLHKMHVATISMYITYLKDIILEVVTTDKHYVEVREILHHNDIQQKYKDHNME